jgi:hypothetical protein
MLRFCLQLGMCVVPFLWTGRTHAEEPIAVWYRSTEGCPDGSAFLLELERRATPARLAGMGDHIDFVVTLGADATRGWGRVERQTERGTVAIRELEAATCAAVASGLALSLVLAVDPNATRPDSPAAVPAPLSSSDAPPQPLPPPSTDSRPHWVDASADPASGEAQPAPSASWRAGVSGSIWTLVGDKPSFGGGPFAELALGAGTNALGLNPVFRLFGFATVPRDVTNDVAVWLLGGRAEICPWLAQLDALELSPCAGVELGALRAERNVPSQPRDTTTWAALAGHGRFAWLITGHLALEGQAGIVAPFGRHDFLAEAPVRVVARSSALGFSAGLGVRVRLP